LDSNLSVELRGDTPFGSIDLKVPLPLHAARRKVPLLHHMAARAIIRDLEESSVVGRCSQERAELFSLHYRVLCQSTAFVTCIDSNQQPVHLGVCPESIRISAPVKEQSMRASHCSTAAHGAVMLAADIRKGSIVMIKGRPCQVAEVTTSKTGKHGHAKVHYAGLDIATGEKLEELCPSSQNLEVLQDLCQTEEMMADEEKEKKEKREKEEPMCAEKARPCKYQKELMISTSKDLESVLRLAAFDGSFSYCAAMDSLLNLDRNAILAWARQRWGRNVDERVLVTALILGLLRSRFIDEWETWGLVAEKAIAWLNAQGSCWQEPVVPDVDTLVTEGIACLRAASCTV